LQQLPTASMPGLQKQCPSKTKPASSLIVSPQSSDAKHAFCFCCTDKPLVATQHTIVKRYISLAIPHSSKMTMSEALLQHALTSVSKGDMIGGHDRRT